MPIYVNEWSKSFNWTTNYITIFKCGESYVRTTHTFYKHFFNSASYTSISSRNSLNSWVKNFRKKGTTMKLKPHRLQKSVRMLENNELACQAFQNSPTRSQWKHASNLHLKQSTIHRILLRNLNYDPYKLLMMQQFQSSDHAVRLKFNWRMLQAIEEKQLPMENILFTDEAHFYLHGHVNKWNLNCENSHSQFLVILRFLPEWVHWDVQTYSIQ